MLREIIAQYRRDARLRYILIAGLIVQLVMAWTSVGSYHPDQHFQIIEFSSYQLGEPHGAAAVWEYYHPVRPSIQIYLFSGWHVVMKSLGILNPYTELTILRLVLGLLMFALFNVLAIHYLREAGKKVVYAVLLILNFSWFLPYAKVQFSSEIISSLFFFGTLLWYDVRKDKNPGFGFLCLIGFLFSLAFYFRFQVGFFLLGFGVWMIWVARTARHILPMAIGFILGTALNTWMDYTFFHRLVITPYEYYYINIIDKRAAMFGTSSFLRYIGLFIAVVAAPPLSLILFFYAGKSFLRNYKHVLFLTTMSFIIAHCLVGHKEERFMFPALFILPVWMGWGLPSLLEYYAKCRSWIRGTLKGITIFSVTLNCIVLVLLVFNPYSQSIHFTELLEKRFEPGSETASVYFLKRSPFETPAHSPYIFYQRYFKKTSFFRVNDNDSLQFIRGNSSYVTTTFDDFEGRRVADSLGYKPVLYSSALLWKINSFLASRQMQPINDIWVLYKKE
jgi:phosphatidylinositol glycan class B